MLSSLRDFGFGKNTTESMIKEEVEQLCRFFEEEGESGRKSVDTNLEVFKAATNVICSLVFAQRLGSEKEFEGVTAMLLKTREVRAPFVLLVVIR